jgi:putative endonuclease
VKGRNCTREVGRLGEDLAARYLQKQGYTILERNYRCQGGEIDLVAKNGDFLVFVEVRLRRSPRFGTPEESITPWKKARLLLAAQSYVAERGWDGFWRIDLLAIELSPKGSVRRINLIKNAVEEG